MCRASGSQRVSMASRFRPGAALFMCCAFFTAEAGLYPGYDPLHDHLGFCKGTRACFIWQLISLWRCHASVTESAALRPDPGFFGAPGAGNGCSGGASTFHSSGHGRALAVARPSGLCFRFSREEKILFCQDLASEPAGALHGFWEMLSDKRIWIFIIQDFSIVIGLYGLGLCMPLMISGLGFSQFQTGLLVALTWWRWRQWC